MCKTKGSKRESTSHGSVITYNNPNYNGVDALNQADSRADSHKPTFLKRLKYDRGQVSLELVSTRESHEHFTPLRSRKT